MARRADRLATIDGLIPAAADVTDGGAVSAAVGEVVDELGGLDALVNAAGINRPGLIADTSEEDWRAILDTNVIGLLNVTRPAMAALRTGVDPTIVNISSNAGHHVTSAQNAVYAASKAAVVALSDALRLELAGQVRVVEVAPGYVRGTEIHRDYRDAEHKREADQRQETHGMELAHFAELVLGFIAQPGDVQVQSALVTKTGYVARPYKS